jgi:hypothetical protein
MANKSRSSRNSLTIRSKVTLNRILEITDNSVKIEINEKGTTSIHIILGLSSFKTSKILFVVFEPLKYTPFFHMSRMPNRKSVFALAGGPMIVIVLSV